MSLYQREDLQMQNFSNIMKQAKKIQERMARLQEELADKTVEATAGGGMVTATVNGRFELVSIKLDKEVVNPEDVEMLQDLIVAAVSEGIRKAQEMASAEMAKITGGFNIPGMPMM
jgi:DNA-binding YbaB/EbfC family protein